MKSKISDVGCRKRIRLSSRMLDLYMDMNEKGNTPKGDILTGHITSGKKGWILRTDVVYEVTGFSPKTVRRYIKLLGIEPRKIRGKPGKFYLWSDVVRMMELFAPPIHLYASKLEDRLRNLKLAGRI
jgi:hypothetical protein